MTSLLIAAALAAAAAQSSDPALPAAPVAVETPAVAAAPAAAETPALATAATPDGPRAPAGTAVVIELAEQVASDKNPRGAKFAIRLAQPLVVDGVELLPAGTPGVGEVVFSAKRGMAGKPGELTVAARYLTYQGATIPLRGMKLGTAGVDKSDAAFVASMMVAPLGFFVQGGEVILPPGTVATAKLGADFGAPAPAAPSTPAAPPAASDAATPAEPAA